MVSMKENIKSKQVKGKSYSPIKSVEVFNFMVYSHAIMNFDDENIINLKGYNSCGKSTMLKAIAVCLMDMYKNSQAKFIRHGEQYFRVVVRFQNGIAILKDKYINGKSLYEVYRDEECLFSTKEGSRLTRVDGVPQQISDFLGLCESSSGWLNYQVRQDPLWLIETRGSENYKSLNEILKAEELARASELLNSDKNKVNSEVAGIEASLQETRLSLIDVANYTDELLSMLEERELKCKKLVSQYRDIESLEGISQELMGITDVPNIGTVNHIQLSDIGKISSTVKSIDETVILPNVDRCDSGMYEEISQIRGYISEIESFPLLSVEGISTMDTNGIQDIINIGTLVNEVYDVMSELNRLDSDHNSVSSKLDSIVNQAKEQGIKFVKCDNCGTYMEVR